MNSSVITDEVLRFMESNTINFIETKRLIESTNLREYHLFNMKYSDIVENFSTPTGNRTESVTGKPITIPSNSYLFHFPAKLKLFDDNESSNHIEPSIQTLYERGTQKRRSLIVYINGIKIPDSVVYVYASPGGTDIFIPSEYFSQVTTNDIVCVIRDYSNGSYNDYYAKTQRGSRVKSIPTKISNINKTQLKVWLNGLYVGQDKYEIKAGSSSFDIIFNEGFIVVEPYDIEVVCDEHQIGKYSEHHIASNGNLFLYVPRDAKALVETSIFVAMCDVYINGLRISPTYLSQKSYRHILYTGSETYDQYVQTEIVVTDNNVEAKAFAEYMNDFMEFEKWSDENGILKSLSDDETETDPSISPKFVSFSTLSFPPSDKYLFDNDETFHMSNSQRAEAMIRENPHYLKNLLKFYGVEEENYEVKRNGIVKEGEVVTILLDLDSQDDKNVNTRDLEVFVNNSKIPDGELKYKSQWDSDNVQIPIRYFSSGRDKTDQVRIYNLPTKNVPVPNYKFSTGTNVRGNEVRVLDITGLTGDLAEYHLSELRVFKQILDKDSDKSHYFVDIAGASVYYELVENSESNYKLSQRYNAETGKDDLYIEIPYGSTIGNNEVVMIINPKFHESVMYNLSKTGDYNSQFRVVLNSVDNGEVIPFITDDYLVKVFLNGKLLVPNLDYTYMTPEDYSALTSTQIIFRRLITLDDVIEVEVTGVKNKLYAAYDEIPVTNKYGFIFFDKLDIPFSLDYMDLYVNDEKLTDDDIVVYTDRLIRIKKELPFKNVVLMSRFKRDITDFEDYISAANFERCDFDEYIRQFCRDVIYDNTELPESNKLQTIFEDLFGEPSNGEDENYTPQERFDTFLDRLTRDYNRDQNLIDKVFDSNKNKAVDVAEYAILVPDTIRESHEVVLDSNSNESISEDWDFDPNRNYRTDLEVIALVSTIFKNANIMMDSNNTLAEYADPLLNRYLYPTDINEFDSNVDYDDFDEDVTIDSNENLSEDD